MKGKRKLKERAEHFKIPIKQYLFYLLTNRELRFKEIRERKKVTAKRMRAIYFKFKHFKFKHVKDVEAYPRLRKLINILNSLLK